MRLYWVSLLATLALVVLLLIIHAARADESTHQDEVVQACRHILSPAMATVHPEYERYLFELCVERQAKVTWHLRAEEYQ